MSLHYRSEWHYERIPGRDNGREWRVADTDDHVVTDFRTEAEAIACVHKHNSEIKTAAAWKYPPKDYEQ